MKNIYDEDYFEHGKGYTDYSWARLGSYFARTARHIVNTYHPSKVLDVGCAKGFLVKALVDLGVDAHGIDVSEYAVAHAHPDIRDRITLGSAHRMPFEAQEYDMTVCFDVLEHIPATNLPAVLRELKRVTTTVVLARIPTKHEPDDHDATHVTIRPREWWLAQFAKAGFTVAPEGEGVDMGVWWVNVPEYLFVCKPT